MNILKQKLIYKTYIIRVRKNPKKEQYPERYQVTATDLFSQNYPLAITNRDFLVEYNNNYKVAVRALKLQIDKFTK